MKNLPNEWLPKIFWAFLLTMASSSLFAQDYPDSTLLTLKLKNGDQLTGYVTAKTPDTVFFKNETVGAIAIPRAEIRIITRAFVKNIGQYWPDSPLEGENLLGPNAFGMRKGERFFRNGELFMNEFGYGLTNHISLDIRALFVPLISPTIYSIKYSKQHSPGIGSSAAIVGFFNIGTILRHAESDMKDVLAVYGLHSFGTRRHSLTVGAGYGFQKNPEKNQYFFHSASYYWRRNGRMAILSDNYFLRNKTGFTIINTVALRFFTENRHVDIGVGVLTSQDFVTPPTFFAPGGPQVSLPLPWVAISLPSKAKSKIPSNR